MNMKDELWPKANTVEIRISDDGTLWIKTDAFQSVKRIILEDKDSQFCKVFYQD